MKTLANRFFSTAFLFLSLCTAFGQSPKVLQGIIVNRNTGEKLAYASVYCPKIGIGTVSNENGEFRFHIPENAEDDSVFISYLGFEKKRLPIHKILSDSIYTISLTPLIHNLKEVIVTAKTRDFNEKRLIRKAINRIPQNYPVDPFELNGYYRDYVRDGIYYFNLIEAAISLQDKGFNTMDYQQSQLRINQIRNNPVFRFDSAENKMLYGKNKKVPHALLHNFYGNEFWILRIHDPLRNFNQFSFSFIGKLKSNFVANHFFHLDSMVYNDKEAFYSISFKNSRTIFKNQEPRRSLSLPVSALPSPATAAFEMIRYNVNGRILINSETFGIHALTYSVDCQSKSYTGLLYDIKLEYKEFNSKLYLNYILFKNYFEYSTTNGFSVYDILLDKERNAINVRFTQPVHPRLWKNAEVILKIDGKKYEIDKTELQYDKVIVYSKEANDLFQTITHEGSERLSLEFKNLQSIYKTPLNESKKIGLFQYREFFVNEVKPKTSTPFSATEIASKDVPLIQVSTKQDADFWNTYNYFLRQPLKN